MKFGGKNFWHIEVYLQFNVVFRVFKCQLVDTHSHT